MCAARPLSRCTRHRRPPTARQPINSLRAALELVALCASPYRCNETIVALLGPDFRPFAVATVTNTAAPDAVIDIVERFAAPPAHDGRAHAMVVASRYTTDVDRDTDAGRLVDRWFEISDLAELAGVELLEWFVITDSIVCPRDLVGEPPRWPAQ